MILEFIEFTLRYGVWTALFLVILRNRKLRRELDKVLPKWARGESEVKEYVTNQQRIESKIDAIMNHLEVRGWNANTSQHVKRNSGKTMISSLADGWRALYARFTTHREETYLFQRRKWNVQKFKSRKFLLALVSGILIILNDGLDMGIDSETVLTFAGLVAVWITGESTVDAVRAKGANAVDYSKADQTGE